MGRTGRPLSDAPGTRVVVGVDIGTTSTKAVAFDASGESWGAGEAGYPLDEPQPGHAVQDPDVVLAAVLRATRAANAEARRRGARIAGLCFSAAMHSLIALDRAGRPLTPSITWADARAATQAERLKTGAAGLELHRRTGTPLHAMSPLPKLIWLREQAAETFAAAHRWVGIKEYVIAQLCGEYVVDHSIASATGLLRQAELDWDAEALALAGVERAQLSRLVPATHVLDLREDIGADPGAPVVVGAADGPLANVGVGAVRPGVAACSIGTSAALRVMVERPAVDPRGRAFCYALAPGRWVTGGAINNGGETLRWAGDALAPELGPGAEAALLDLAAQAPAGSGGLLMLPSLLGERAPHWSHDARGAYAGLTRAHRREHLIRAALEGVCFQLAVVLHAMRDAGTEVREIRATGGFARSPLWRQMLADTLSMDIGFTAGRQGASFGAALLGMQALGIVESLDVAAGAVAIHDVSRPQPEAAATYAALLPVFAGLHDALAPTAAALRRLA